mmetsp:Transcript_4465/g.12410  ORF Transcript_4465/g.12410 Transcript_4465/m.12410 type:complete len:342 (+) Transcript_4465:82-1107(+)
MIPLSSNCLAELSSAFTATPLPNVLVHWCSQAAPAASILVSAAPIPTLWNLWQQQQQQQNQQNQQQRSPTSSSIDVPLLPYSTLAGNCCLWTTYGLLESQRQVWLPNAVGLALALGYMATYLHVYNNMNNNQNSYEDKEQTNTKQQNFNDDNDILPGSIQHHTGSVVAILAVSLGILLLNDVAATTTASSSIQILSQQQQLQHDNSFTTLLSSGVGHAAVACCIALFASPLSTLRQVVQTRNAASIPLPFSVASVVTCFLWSISGWWDLHDVNVVTPNVLGLLLGCAQLALIAVYGQETTGGRGREEEVVETKHMAVLLNQDVAVFDKTIIPHSLLIDSLG